MFHWIHHLFTPHCQECEDAVSESKVCQSCETLKMQLSIANHEKSELLKSILSLTSKSPEGQAPPTVDYEKLKPQMMTWDVRKRLLEAEDRKAAQLLAERKKKSEEIAELEKELGVEEGVD